MSQTAPKYPAFKPAKFTALSPDSLLYTDPNQAQDTATEADRRAYRLSDEDMAARHPDLVAANRLNEENLLRAERGELPPGYAAELNRAGLGAALSSFGSVAAPGSTGTNRVARGLGLGILGYDQAVNQELQALNASTPARSFGLGGQGVLSLELANRALRNQVAIGNFQGQNQVAIANTGNANAAAQGGFAAALNASAQQAATNAAIGQAVGTVVGGVAGGTGALGSGINATQGAALGGAAGGAAGRIGG